MVNYCPYCLKKWNKKIPLKYEFTSITGKRNYSCNKLCGNKFIKGKDGEFRKVND